MTWFDVSSSMHVLGNAARQVGGRTQVEGMEKAVQFQRRDVRGKP